MQVVILRIFLKNSSISKIQGTQNLQQPHSIFLEIININKSMDKWISFEYFITYIGGICLDIVTFGFIMNHNTNAEMTDIRIIYRIADGKSLQARRLQIERFPGRNVSGRKFFEDFHRRLH